MQNVPEQGPEKPDLPVKLALLWAVVWTRDLQSFSVSSGVDLSKKLYWNIVLYDAHSSLWRDD